MDPSVVQQTDMLSNGAKRKRRQRRHFTVSTECVPLLYRGLSRVEV